MYFVYVYIVLCFVGLRWVALGPHFASWGDFAPPFGSLWGALGSQGALLGVTLASLWLPWDSVGPFGAPWAPKGTWDDFGSKMDVQFRANGSQVRNLRTKSNLAEFSRGSPLSPRSGISTQSGARAAAPNPTSLAPGARMTVVKHTPSKKELFNFLMLGSGAVSSTPPRPTNHFQFVDLSGTWMSGQISP